MPGGGSLVPPWADQDPPPPDEPQLAPAAGDLPASPLQGTRRALRDYLNTGDRAKGRTALGRYARSMGGGGAAARHARAIRTGSAAIGAFASAGRGQPAADGFDLGQLAGRPLEEAIGAIVDRFCPSGILDEELARAAITEALVEALDGADLFDPAAIDDRAVVVATVCFVSELVFASIAAEQGQAADQISPDLAVRRENGLRDLVREVADHVATPIIQRHGGALAAAQIQGVVGEITAAVYAEMASWE